MRVQSCTSMEYRIHNTYGHSPKAKLARPVKIEKNPEPNDYGKGLKQLSYVIGMSVLGISSIVLGTRGKLCGIKI